jgi:ABC-type transport system substrate-binding protein
MLAMGCTAAQPTGQTPNDQPKSGGTLNIRDTAFYTNLDPTQALRGEASLIATRVMDALVRYKVTPGTGYDENVLVPAIAEKWETAADGKSFTFHLRKVVKFQNVPPVNGRELTSEDVKWSFEYISRTGRFKDVKFAKSNQIAFQFEGLDRIDTPDPYTAVVVFKEAFAPFMSYSASKDMYITAKEAYEAGTINDKPVGPGPWMADIPSWQSDAVMVFKKNPDYWQTGKPYVDAVRQIVITDEASAKAAFQTKQIDVLGETESTRDAEEMMKVVPNALYATYMGHNALRIYYNVRVAPFNNVKFRQALSLATDRDEFVKTATGGKGRYGIDGGLPLMFTDEEARKMAPYDPEQAKKLLAEIGYTSNPITIECLYTTAYGEQLLQDMQLAQSQWKKVGINMIITTMDRTDLSNRRRDGNYMMAPTGSGGGEAEPDFYAWFYFHPKSGSNYYQVNDQKLTDFADGQRRQVDPEKRMQMLRDEAKYIHEQGFALWPYFSPGFSFYHPYVKGFTPHRSRGVAPSPEVWLDK